MNYERSLPGASPPAGVGDTASNNRVRISVIMACRNELSTIEGSVKSLLGQDLTTADFEIIVVDGMSSDGTREILERMGHDEYRLRVLDNPGVIAAAALNLGIQAANGQYIAIVSAHGRYAANYLATCLEIAAETGADNVGGGVDVEGIGLLGRAINLVHHSRFSVGGAAWHNRGYEGYADTVCGGFYNRTVFERLGEFDIKMVRTEDDEFNLRLRKSGGTIYCSPRIRTSYTPRRKYREVFWQYAQYGYWRIAVIRKHGRPSSLRQVVPAACIIVCALLTLVAIRWPWSLLVVAGTGMSYLITVAAISWRLAGNANADRLRVWREPGLVAAIVGAFLCFHCGYGLGSMVGLVDLLVGRYGQRQHFRQLTRG